MEFAQGHGTWRTSPGHLSGSTDTCEGSVCLLRSEMPNICIRLGFVLVLHFALFGCMVLVFVAHPCWFLVFFLVSFWHVLALFWLLTSDGPTVGVSPVIPGCDETQGKPLHGKPLGPPEVQHVLVHLCANT